jgi:hypothetical protein
MKAVVNIEFIIAVFVFLVTLSFILITIGGNLAPLHRDVGAGDLRSKAHQISQILLFDEGDPKNWDGGDVNRVGLSTGEKHMVSRAKISRLAQLCQSEGFLQDMLLGNRNVEIEINITDESGGTIASCGGIANPEFYIQRFAVTDAMEIIGIEVAVR